MTSLEFKKKCIELREQTFTLKEISQTLERSKTSVYFHIKNIPKTNVLLAKIREENLSRLNRIRPNLKGISWKNPQCNKFQEWTPDLVNLVAHTIFDGQISKAGAIYYNSNSVLIENFKSKIKLIYDHNPATYHLPNGVTRVCYFSAELRDFLLEKREELLEDILLLDKEKQKAFLISFFDDEGCVTFNRIKHRRKVRGFQHNIKILLLVQKLLNKFSIRSKIYKDFYEIEISRKENLKKFAQEINFSKGVRVNGKRSNSVWKKSFEKRIILANLLASYRH